MERAYPVPPGQRNEQIDILRGFALAGILFVNVFSFNASLFDFGGFYGAIKDPLSERIYHLLIGIASDKFIFLFSLLFGMGFYMIYSKPWENERGFTAIYTRRLFFLGIFGILHTVLFYAGDILLSYAILGFVLLAIRKWKSTTLAVLSFLLYFFPPLYIFLQGYFPILPDSLSSVTNYTLEQIIPVYSGSSFIEVTKLRIHEFLAFRNINIFYYWPKILSLFIAGMLIMKHGIIDRINRNRENSSAVLFFTIAIAIFFYFTFEYIAAVIAGNLEHAFPAVYMGMYEVMNIFFGFGYALLILCITSWKTGKTILRPFSYAGRMALTNYIMQSLICSFIFYGYGLGYFGMTRLENLLYIALGTIVFQIAASWLYLRYFKYGPLEWLWRMLTYGHFRKL